MKEGKLTSKQLVERAATELKHGKSKLIAVLETGEVNFPQ